MPGINILAEYTAGGVPVWGCTVLIVVAVVGLILLLCGICADNDVVTEIGLIALISFIIVGVAVKADTEPEHTRYKVTISDEVNLIEFLEKYEILDTEGEIYTIREVTPDA